MKYSTFARLRIVALLGLLVLPFAWIGCHKATTPPPTTAPMPVSASPQQNAPAVSDSAAPSNAPAPVSDTAAFTDVHKAILKLQKEPLSKGMDNGDSIKWVYSEDGIKAEFRCDKNKGFNYWNRVKIDYNGNKKDDERWDFGKDGKVKRRVSPNDDGNYTEEYTLQGEQWIKK